MQMRMIALFIFLFPLLSAQTQHADMQELQVHIDRLRTEFDYNGTDAAILISIQDQELYLTQNGAIKKTYKISSAIVGANNKSGSRGTPLGVHQVSDKFGDGAPIGAIFKARQNTGKIAKIITEPIDVEEDDVTTRVMWLDGLEPGINKGGNVDSKGRYIYIHGTPEEGLIGQPASHGCIRMYNTDVVELFNSVDVGCLVLIY